MIVRQLEGGLIAEDIDVFLAKWIGSLLSLEMKEIKCDHKVLNDLDAQPGVSDQFSGRREQPKREVFK